jgi:hypothetical protein
MHYVEVRFPDPLLDEATSYSEALYDAFEEGAITHDWVQGLDYGDDAAGDGPIISLELDGNLKCVLDVVVHTLRRCEAPAGTFLYVVSDGLRATDQPGTTYRLGDLARG